MRVSSRARDRKAELRIRELALSDMARLQELEDACFGADAYDERIFTSWLLRAPELFLGAEQEGRLVAYIIAHRAGSRSHIVSIGVHPTARRRGIGSRLVSEVLERLRVREAKTVTLESRSDNSVSIRFWTAHGFRPIGVALGYYEDGSSALRMRRQVEPSGP